MDENGFASCLATSNLEFGSLMLEVMRCSGCLFSLQQLAGSLVPGYAKTAGGHCFAAGVATGPKGLCVCDS